MEKIYTLQAEEISSIIEEIGFRDSDYMILEKVDSIKFTKYKLKTFEDWEKGIIFSADKEFKWRYFDGQFHVVFSGDDISLDDTNDFTKAKIDKENFPIILWGQRSPEMKCSPEKKGFPENEYIELPIPAILSYPIKSEYRVKVRLKIQKNMEDEIIGYRFSEIIKEAKK